MTVSNEDARTGPYNGDGVTTNFDFDFLLLEKSHLVVTLTAADGTSTEQTLNTDYTIPDGDVDDPSGGTITMTTAPASGEQLTITREVSRDQQVDLQNRGSFFPQTIENALDKLTQIVQDHRELLNRSIKQAVTESDELTFPAAVDGQVIGWDGTQLVNRTAVSGGTLLNINEVLGKIGAQASGIALAEQQVLGRLTGGNLAGLSAGDLYAILREAGLDPEDATDGVTDAYDSEATTGTPATGETIDRDFQSANTTTTPTLDGVTIKNRDGSALWVGALNGHHRLYYDGADYRVLDPKIQGEDPILTALRLTGTSRLRLPVGTTAQRPGSPSEGDIRRNSTTGKFEGYSGSEWGTLGGGAQGGGANSVFFENDTNVTEDYTVTPSKNALSAGPVIIDNGVTVTIPDGSVWTVVGG